jgi:hypothetical protein
MATQPPFLVGQQQVIQPRCLKWDSTQMTYAAVPFQVFSGSVPAKFSFIDVFGDAGSSLPFMNSDSGKLLAVPDKKSIQDKNLYRVDCSTGQMTPVGTDLQTTLPANGKVLSFTNSYALYGATGSYTLITLETGTIAIHTTVQEKVSNVALLPNDNLLFEHNGKILFKILLPTNIAEPLPQNATAFYTFPQIPPIEYAGNQYGYHIRFFPLAVDSSVQHVVVMEEISGVGQMPGLTFQRRLHQLTFPGKVPTMSLLSGTNDDCLKGVFLGSIESYIFSLCRPITYNVDGYQEQKNGGIASLYDVQTQQGLNINALAGLPKNITVYNPVLIEPPQGHPKIFLPMGYVMGEKPQAFLIDIETGALTDLTF